MVLFAIQGSPIAQSVEQMTVNHWVTGSSPVRGANKINTLPGFFQTYIKWLASFFRTAYHHSHLDFLTN